MNEFTIISLLLLLQVILDASGDAFRFRGWQIVHHMTESIQIAGWFAIWALFGFDWQFIVMYIMGRIVVFDLVFNLIAGNKLFYVGESDLIGKLMHRLPVAPEHISFITKFIAALVWIAGVINQSVG